jgi:sulfonate dioxygenase
MHLQALYSSLSRGMQIYLEGLTALHSAVAQADGARGAGLAVRREPIETAHPVVRVHPATGWKSVYVNPGMPSRPLPNDLALTHHRIHAPHHRGPEG